MRTRSFGVALSIVMLSAISLNATASPKSMAKLDLNGDSIVDKTEFLSGANQRFSEMDVDANGFVTQDERRSFKKQKRSERAQRRFQRGDANNDGFISQQEFDAAQAEREQRREEKRAQRIENRELRNDNRETREVRKGERQRFKRDANGDGVIDVAEHTAAAEHAFARMDKNGDGVLSQDELKRKKRRGGKRHKRSGR